MMTTKILKAFALVFTIALFGLMLISRVMMFDILSYQNNQLEDLYARKEDISLANNNLEVLINDLNLTLNTEIAQNIELKSELEQALNDKKISLENRKIAQQTAAPPPPAPKTIYRVVTRAS